MSNRLESKDKRSKRSDTRASVRKLLRAKRQQKKVASKYGDVSEAAEKGSRAVRKVTKAEDRVKRRAAIAGRDPGEVSSMPKTSSKPKSKPPKPSSKKKKPPKSKPMFAEKQSLGQKILSKAKRKAANRQCRGSYACK